MKSSQVSAALAALLIASSILTGCGKFGTSGMTPLGKTTDGFLMYAGDSHNYAVDENGKLLLEYDGDLTPVGGGNHVYVNDISSETQLDNITIPEHIYTLYDRKLGRIDSFYEYAAIGGSDETTTQGEFADGAVSPGVAAISVTSLYLYSPDGEMIRSDTFDNAFFVTGKYAVAAVDNYLKVYEFFDGDKIVDTHEVADFGEFAGYLNTGVADGWEFSQADNESSPTYKFRIYIQRQEGEPYRVTMTYDPATGEVGQRD